LALSDMVRPGFFSVRICTAHSACQFTHSHPTETGLESVPGRSKCWIGCLSNWMSKANVGWTPRVSRETRSRSAPGGVGFRVLDVGFRGLKILAPSRRPREVLTCKYFLGKYLPLRIFSGRTYLKVFSREVLTRKGRPRGSPERERESERERAR